MNHRTFAVISGIGPDRPGLVADVTHAITEYKGNIEDSRAAIFGAEFGLMMLVSFAEDDFNQFEKAMNSLSEKTGLSVLLRRTKSPEEHRRSTSFPCVVSAEALDHEGIVRDITQVLYDIGINIVSLETSTYHAPVTGSPLFRLEARVDVPRGATLAQLRTALHRVAEREAIDIDVRSLV